MKFRVDRDVLADAVAWAARSLPVRPSVPVLSGLLIEASDDGLVLGNLVASGGAAAAGLHPGDVVLRIDGQTISELGFTDAISRLRGEEGTVVRLEVRRADGTTAMVDVVRRPISF